MPTRVVVPLWLTGFRMPALSPPSGTLEMNPVEPVIAAVIAPDRNSIAPELVGLEKSTAPRVKVMARAWASKEKMELEPRRANVRSVNSSSARDSVPVRTTFSLRTMAPCEAGRGSEVKFGASVTTLTFCRTTAWDRSAADPILVNAMQSAAARIVKHRGELARDAGKQHTSRPMLR